MKKLIAIILSMIFVSSLAGCSKNEAVTGDLPPMLTINGCNYIAKDMPIAELPDDFECVGELTVEEANDTGLQGCKYYANIYISSFDEFYVYQECGTPIDENTIDATQLQWAYVKWTREGFTTGSGEPVAGGADMPNTENNISIETEQMQQAVTDGE